MNADWKVEKGHYAEFNVPDRRQESQEFQTKNSIPHDPQNPESSKSEGKSQMLDGLKS